MTGAATAQRVELTSGLDLFPGWLDDEAQRALLADVRAVLLDAPLFTPVMPRSGTPFSVRMSNCGPLGWISDRDGYRYSPDHPVTHRRWPPMPAAIVRAWEALAAYDGAPEACLINYYAPDARMGLHQDRDEETFVAPVLSLSLGDSCVFRFGGEARRGPTRSVKLHSGDALIIGGAARLAFHGVDRILGGSSSLLPEGGRFNLTVRRVSAEREEDRDPSAPASATR